VFRAVLPTLQHLLASSLTFCTYNLSVQPFILINLPPSTPSTSTQPPLLCVLLNKPSATMSYSYATAKAVLSDVEKDRILAMHLSSDTNDVS